MFQNENTMSNEKSDEVEGKPLELAWCCGVNTRLEAVDLTTPEREYTIAFAANHLVILQVKR